MSEFSFLHVADLHLDTPFEGLAKVQPEWAAALRDASLHALERLVDQALELQVAFVLFAGDIYDGEERGVRAQLAFRRGLQRLSEAGIASFIVHGNHDPLGQGGWSAIRSWPELVHVFPAGEPQRLPVQREGELLAMVQGVSFGQRAERENLARRFGRGPEPCLQVGLLHANAGGQAGHDPYAPCSLEDLRAADLDYWALGHVHSRQTLFSGEQWAVYPGNLQGRSFKPSERGEKGAVLVKVAAAKVQALEFLPLAPLRFEELSLDVSECLDFSAVLRAAEEQVQARIRDGDEGLLLRLSLTGSTALHAELQRSSQELLQGLQDQSVGGRPWIAWERLELKTRPEVSRHQLLEQPNLLGALLRQLDALREGGTEDLLAELNTPLASGTLGRHIPPLEEEGLSRLLEAVEGEALARLWGET